MARTAPIYDGIGRVYARHRRADPRIAAQIDRALGDARTIVNVGAGTGSYEPGDRAVVAVEPSVVMATQRAGGAAPVIRAVAERLPFADGAFDAALAVFTIHHWTDVVGGLRETARVARTVAVLTFDPTVHGNFWLFDYVPEARALPSYLVMPPDAVAEVIGAQSVEPVMVPFDCVDSFNCAFWRRPEQYLDPDVRACMSGLAMLSDDLVTLRMDQLRDDIADGTWQARYGALLDLDAIDGGLRLVVRR